MSTAGILSTFSLQGRTALVTGGYRGLGLAFARGLAQAGADVVIGGRTGGLRRGRGHPGRRDRPHRRRRRARRHRPVIGAGRGRDRNRADRAARRPRQQRRSCIHRPALEIPEHEWRQVFDVNVHGLWSMSQTVARHPPPTAAAPSSTSAPSPRPSSTVRSGSRPTTRRRRRCTS